MSYNFVDQIHGRLYLERREAALNEQIKAQEREFEGVRREKQAINEALDREYEIAFAKRSLIVGDLTSDQKEAMLEKVKGDKEFEDVYQKQVEKEQESSEMEEIILSQNEQIEELNMEVSKVDGEIRKERKIGKWKRRILSLLCIRIEDDDDDDY